MIKHHRSPNTTKSQSNQPSRISHQNYWSWTSHQINMSYKSINLLFIAAAVLFAATSAVPAPTLPVKVAPDCSLVSCLRPVCEEGEELFVPPGQCCPLCITSEGAPDCSDIFCPAQACEEGEKAVIPPGQCCPVCVPKGAPDCSAIFCLAQACEDGEKAVIPPGQCCPVCVPKGAPDCSAIFCLAQACEDGEKAVISPGQCCPVCVPDKSPVDCSTILCLLPVCKEGEMLIDIPGQCCPQCVSAAPICSLKPDSGPCEAAIRKFFYNSTTDRCELFIYGGCGGNDNRFDTRSECISACGADNPCTGVSCRRGSTCKVDDGTGEAFCEPSCKLDNGGCQSDEICELETVQCVRAPCPPVVNCRPRSKRSVENDCPPTCSVEFCSNNPTAQCSNPGPRGLPGCTGSCQLTYCHACYSGKEFIPRPETCPTCKDLRDYLFDSRCFRQWADCVSRKLIHLDASHDDLKCFSPPCPFKG